MEKCSKKRNNGRPVFLRPGSVLLTTGLLMMASAPVWAANETGLMSGPRIESVAQDGRTVTVTVSDAMGELIGANVIVKGTTNGNVTDMNGQVILQDVPANAILEVSYIGYQTKEVPVGNQTNIRVTLSEDSQALEEVVVVGYGTMEKKQVTSSVTSLSASDMMKGVGGSDITTSLQGKISGLVMANSGGANEKTTIQLRGLTSINSGKEPLIVVDGFPGGDIRALNQDDIKSIDVLKDASAGAIYGTRAASGVILITTKSGSNTNGKVKLRYSTELSKKQNYGKPEMLTADEYRARTDVNIVDYGSSADWWDAMINKDNFSQKHHLSLELGSENAQVYTSFFYETNEGIAIKDDRKDYGGRLNANFKLFDGWLEIRPIVDYRRTQRTSFTNNDNADQDDQDEDLKPNFKQALYNNPTRSPYDPDSPSGYNVWTGETLDYNIVADRMLNTYEGIDTWFKPEVTMKLNIKPVAGLSYTQTLGYENRQYELHSFDSRYHRNEVTNNRSGKAYLSFQKMENLTSEGYFTYLRDFEGGHNINAVAGYSYFEKNGEFFSATNYNFLVDNVKFWDLGKGTYLADGKAAMRSAKDITERLFAIYARANYSYQDKYMLSATIRHEGSSKFAADNRWGNFWAVSAGWRLSGEEFMKEFDWLSDLKFRFGYGVTGNNDFDASYMANTLSSDAYWMLPTGGWAYTYGPTSNVNPGLGWEEKKEWNVGIDYAFLNNRIYGKFDVYRRKIDGMLYNVNVPQPPYPNGQQWQNIGEMESKGWEFEIGADIIQTKDFTWTSNLNLSHNSGKVLSTWGDGTQIVGNAFDEPGWPGDASLLEDGAEIGAYYIWKFAGFDENGEFLLYNKDGEVIPAGDKTVNDKQYIGNYLPKVMMGWNNTFRYKNFDLGINMRSWIGFDVYNTWPMYLGIQGANGAGQWNLWKPALSDERYNKIRGVKQLCDYFLEDGSFLKIDAITLGYTMSLKKYTKDLVDQVRIYATVGNVATITGYSGYNPEVNITGWTGGVDKVWNCDPMVRTYTLGIQVAF